MYQNCMVCFNVEKHSLIIHIISELTLCRSYGRLAFHGKYFTLKIKLQILFDLVDKHQPELVKYEAFTIVDDQIILPFDLQLFTTAINSKI